MDAAPTWAEAVYWNPVFSFPEASDNDEKTGNDTFKMAASDYLNEMRRHFENNSRTKDFVAHTAKVCKEKLLYIVNLVILGL